jgi:hypothetical protein
MDPAFHSASAFIKQLSRPRIQCTECFRMGSPGPLFSRKQILFPFLRVLEMPKSCIAYLPRILTSGNCKENAICNYRRIGQIEIWRNPGRRV